MTNRAYRLNMQAFFRETNWIRRGTEIEERMDEVRSWFNSNMDGDKLDALADDHTGYAYRGGANRWTMLMSWMQAMDFNQPVDTAFKVPAKATLIAYRRGPSSGGHQFGMWYTLPGEDRNRLGLPPGNIHPHKFKAKSSITCLATTVADAFLAWWDGPERYAVGGAKQLFIPESWNKLQPD